MRFGIYHSGFELLTGQYRQHHPEFALNSCATNVSTTYLMGKSPFTFLDKFVEFVASVGNVSGDTQFNLVILTLSTSV